MMVKVDRVNWHSNNQGVVIGLIKFDKKYYIKKENDETIEFDSLVVDSGVIAKFSINTDSKLLLTDEQDSVKIVKNFREQPPKTMPKECPTCGAKLSPTKTGHRRCFNYKCASFPLTPTVKLLEKTMSVMGLETTEQAVCDKIIKVLIPYLKRVPVSFDTTREISNLVELVNALKEVAPSFSTTARFDILKHHHSDNAEFLETFEKTAFKLLSDFGKGDCATLSCKEFWDMLSFTGMNEGSLNILSNIHPSKGLNYLIGLDINKKVKHALALHWNKISTITNF